TRASALHHVDVLNRDRAAVAEVDHQDRETDRRLRRRHGQHHEREDLAHQVVVMDRERHEVDVDREQQELDRHQDDDDVLAVEKDAEHAEREQDRRDREVVAEADQGHGGRHQETPWRGGTLTSTTDSSRVRPTWRAITWRRTPSRWRKVSTIAPIIATSSTRPAAWNT